MRRLECAAMIAGDIECWRSNSFTTASKMRMRTYICSEREAISAFRISRHFDGFLCVLRHFDATPRLKKRRSDRFIFPIVCALRHAHAAPPLKMTTLRFTLFRFLRDISPLISAHAVLLLENYNIINTHAYFHVNNDAIFFDTLSLHFWFLQ